jgi:hypothetical protein
MKKFLNILSTLQVGDRIVVPKSNINWVQHHAIYLGLKNGRHLIIENKEGFGVRVVYAETFFSGVFKITRIIRFLPKYNYSRNDLAKYALSKRGKAYDLWNYNCEHFVNEVQNRVIKSDQSNTGKGLAALGIAALLIAGLASLGNRK